MSRKIRRKTSSGAVKLRMKELANGNHSLYLDIYRAGKRKYEFLGLYFIGDKYHDDEVRRLAETIRAQREIEFQARSLGIIPTHHRHRDFVDYFAKLVEVKNGCNWKSTLNHLRSFADGILTFDQLTADMIENLKQYLLARLHHNTAHTYFINIKAALNQAVREGLILTSPAKYVDSIGVKESTVVHLTLDEIRCLARTDCPNESVKRAFLFACFTGMCRCDVRELTWSQIVDDLWVEYHRRKTKVAVKVGIPPQAKEYIGRRGADNERVFKDLPVDRYIGIVLVKWSQRAGITKNVSFHVARHTFATLSLTYGVDIYTVSKLLGHRNVLTTQIYTKVLDEKRHAAMTALPTF